MKGYKMTTLLGLFFIYYVTAIVITVVWENS